MPFKGLFKESVMWIVILDDEEPRQEAMRRVLNSLGVHDEIKFFDNAPDMIA